MDRIGLVRDVCFLTWLRNSEPFGGRIGIAAHGEGGRLGL